MRGAGGLEAASHHLQLGRSVKFSSSEKSQNPISAAADSVSCADAECDCDSDEVFDAANTQR
jgi:hypothetical protein